MFWYSLEYKYRRIHEPGLPRPLYYCVMSLIAPVARVKQSVRNIDPYFPHFAPLFAPPIPQPRSILTREQQRDAHFCSPFLP